MLVLSVYESVPESDINLPPPPPRLSAPPVPQKKAPLFSEQAQIVTVDTLEGLLCTHQVSSAVIVTITVTVYQKHTNKLCKGDINILCSILCRNYSNGVMRDAKQLPQQ